VRRALVFAPQAERALLDLQLYITEQSSVDRASHYVDRILEHCELLTDFPDLGKVRDDIAPGVRVTGFERRITLAYSLTAREVRILGVYASAMDWERLMRDESARPAVGGRGRDLDEA
jgi:toxin ParE1/3/4